MTQGLTLKNKTMASIINERMVKAYERFNADLQAFAEETGEKMATLYEDINTERVVSDFRLYKNGKLTWKEEELTWTRDGHRYIVKPQSEVMLDEEDAKDYLAFWRANLRRAKRYWKTDADTFDRMADGEIADNEED